MNTQIKKYKLYLFQVLLILFFMPKTQALANDSAPKSVYLTEVNFELEENKGLPAGWYTEDLTYRQDKESFNKGKTSGFLTVKQKENYIWPGLVHFISNFNFEDDMDYFIEVSYSAKIKMGNFKNGKPGSLYLGIENLNEKHKRAALDQGNFINGKSDWTNMHYRSKIPTTAGSNMIVKFIVYGPGEVWLDDIKVVITKNKPMFNLNAPPNHRLPGVVYPQEPEPSPDEFIKVGRDKWTFEGATTGKAFVPWGTTLLFVYANSTDYKEPGLWHEKYFDINRIEKAFAMMQKLNLNVVKIPLTAAIFLKGVTSSDNVVIDKGALNRFDQILALAKKYKIRLFVQHLSHWEGAPSWWGSQIGKMPDHIPIEKKFWEQFVSLYKNEPSIFCWSLSIETTIHNFSMKKYKSNYQQDFVTFLQTKYKSIKEVNKSWKTNYTSWAQVNVSPNSFDVNKEHLYDTQLYRVSIGDNYLREISEIIRKNDPNHLIGICPILYNPLERGTHYVPSTTPFSWSALTPEVIAKHLDFIDIHIYPGFLKSLAIDMELAKYTMRLAYCGKPVILGEFGDFSREATVIFNSNLIESTIGLASGWIPWSFACGAGDSLTTSSGLVENDYETVTEWGKVFSTLKRTFMLDSRAGVARDNYDPYYFKIDMKKTMTQPFENYISTSTYSDDLIKILQLGSRKVRFVKQPWQPVPAKQPYPNISSK